MTVPPSYKRAAIDAGVTVAIAWALASLINRAKLGLPDGVVRGLQVISAYLFAVVTLGKAGWSIQSWTDKTALEEADKGYQRWLYLGAFGFLVLSLLL